MAEDLGGDDPFAGFLTGEAQPAAEQPPQQPSTALVPAEDPFAEFLNPSEDEQTDQLGAFGRSFARGVVPAAGGMVGAGGGAALGAALGAPFAGVGAIPGAIIGGFVGGMAGGFGGSIAANEAQEWTLDQLPEDWVDAIGQGDEQRALDQKFHPTETFLGGLAPNLLTMRPGGFGTTATKLPANATAFQRILANPVTGRLFGGAVVGGMELGNEVAAGEQPDWVKVGIATGFGVVFNKQTKFGDKITALGEDAAVGAVRVTTGIEIPKLMEVPTVAQAADAKVMGPGVTEEVFMGTNAQSPQSELTAQDFVRNESVALDRVLAPEVDINTVARHMEPEVFSEYDTLKSHRDDLMEHYRAISESGAEIPIGASIARQIAAIDTQLREIAPNVGAAYRRAADVAGSEVIEPDLPVVTEPLISADGTPAPETPEATTQRTIEEQAQAIAADVARQLIAAGRPAAEANATAQLLGRRWVTRAARLGNTISPEVLYETEGATIRGYGRREPPPTSKPPLMPTVDEPALASPVREVPVVAEQGVAPAERRNLPASEIEALDPSTIGVDAKRFQFKEGGDAEGVSERLQDIQQWDARLAGTALVFRDADGKDWIADGHQRLGLAKRLAAGGQQGIRLNAFVLDAADGITDVDARAIAAIKNIAEGTGTATDAAKVLRAAKDSGIDLPPLPPRSTLVRDGRALANLSPEAFGIIVNNVVPTNQGAIVGRMVHVPEQQVEALRLLATLKPENALQAELIVRDMLSSGTTEGRQESLFGVEDYAGSIVLERAKIADEAFKQLRRDKATFRTLVDEAERIQGAGANVLDQTANQSRLATDEQAADFLKQLAFRAGPVSDALSEVARKLKSGEIKSAEAARTFLKDVRRAVEEGVVTGPDAGVPVAGAAGDSGPELFQSGVKPAAWKPGDMLGEFETERGQEGFGQALVPGVKPRTDAERLREAMAKPLVGGEAPAAKGGLFDVEGREDAADQMTLFQPAPPIDTPEFNNWFGDSKVVDESGAPLVVYHGTNQPIEQFDLTRGGMATGDNAGATKGFFFTDSREVADQYATHAGERIVSNIAAFEKEQSRLKKEVDRLERVAQRTGDWAPYEKAMAEWEDLEIGATREDASVGANAVEAYLSIRNPMVVDFEGGRLTAAKDVEAFIDQAKAAGHDGLILRNLEDSPKMGVVSDQFVAFDPTQIKSTANRGAFDPNDPRILFQSAESADAGPFYSATLRAVETSKNAKASADQWIGTIRNTPGIKAEEIEWIGLEPWLRSQKGSISREEVADFIRANQIEVDEVTLGDLSQVDRDVVRPSEAVIARHREEWDRLVAQQNAAEYGTAPYNEARNLMDDLHGKMIDETMAEAPRPEVDGPAKFDSYVMPGGENYRELLLTLPEKDGGFDPAKVTFERIRRSETQGSIKIAYDGQNLGTFDDVHRLNSATKRWEGESDDAIIAIAFRRYNGSRDLGIKPLDQGKAFRSSHYEQPNILAHIRFNERTDTQGNKTLFIEEIQSDWHQTGRNKGYRKEQTPDEKAAREAEMNRLVAEESKLYEASTKVYLAIPAEVSGGKYKSKREALDSGDRETMLAIVRAEEEHNLGPLAKAWVEARQATRDFRAGGMDAVPDAPFKTTWPELALKRMIRWAAEKGYDQIAWTPGHVQAERYDLSQQVSEISYRRNDDGTYLLGVTTTDGNSPYIPNSERMSIEQIADTVGKEMAEKISRGDGEAKGGLTTLSGMDLKVGGEGMVEFYDRMLVGAANKLGKKYGAKVGKARINSTDAPDSEFLKYPEDHPYRTTNMPDVHAMPVTEEMRAAAMGGQALFQQKRGSITFADGKKPLIKLFADADASTFLHETGHQWLEELMRDAVHQAATDVVKTDAATVRKWLNIGDDGKIATKSHEKFARSFEQYLREGVAPSAGLARVFAQFKSWLTTIYQSIKGLGTPINEDIRQVFDRMIEMEPNRTVVAPERESGIGLHAAHEAEAASAHPADADATGDRIVAEIDAYIAQQPQEIQDELALAAAAVAPADTGTEAGGSATGQPEVVGGGAEPGSVAEGGGGGVEPGPLGGGGNVGMGEGTGASTADSGDAAGLREQRPGAADAARPQPLAPDPTTLFGPDESPFTDKAGNIRVENLTSSEDVAQAIRDAANENNDFIGDRRGVITDGQVLDLAEALGMDAESLNKRKLGEAFNAESIIAARKLLIQSATDVSALMKKAAIGTDEDVMAYAEAKARHQMIQAQVAGITAEAGRALRAFRNIAGQEQALGVDQFLKSATGKTLFQLREEIKLGATLDTPAKVSKFMRDAEKPGFTNMMAEYWINGLVSGPKTHVTNMIGNTILALTKAGPDTAVAAIIGAARKAAGREGPTVRMGEVGAQIGAAVRSLPSAAKAAIGAVKTGRSTILPGEVAEADMFQQGATEFAPAAVLDENATAADAVADLFGLVQGMTDGLLSIGKMLRAGGDKSAPFIGFRKSQLGAIPDIAVRGVPVLPVGSVIRIPTRMLAAGDSFFRAVNYSMEKNAIAYRTASEEALQGSAFNSRVAEIRQNPTADVMDASRESATALTLMSRRSDFVKALSRLANTKLLGFPIVKFIIPFINTPANIIEQTVVQRTPIGLFSPEIRADLAGKNGTVAQDTAMAKMLLGSAISVGFGALAAQGLASGSGPSDQNENSLWRLAGNQAHSVRIGDMWYQVNQLGPMGMLMGIAADMYDVSHAAQEGDMEKAAGELLQGFTQNILDASFMTGPSDLIEALQDPDRYGQQYIRNFLSSFVPFSGAMGQTARVLDPYSRQARETVDAIKAKIPGMSQELMPRRDIWGEPILNRTAVGSQLVTGIYTQQVSQDPVNQAMLAAGYWPGAVQRKIRGVELTDEQYDLYAQVAGRMAKQRLDVMVRSPQWASWPVNVKHDVISETIRQSRETARGMMFSRFPNLVVEATRLKLAPLQE